MIVARDAPPRARMAIGLLWACVAFALGQTLVEDYMFNTSTVGVVAVGLAIYGLVVFRASRRHNWARYVLLVWTALGAAVYLYRVPAEASHGWDHLLAVLSYSVEIVAICMLFTGEVGRWYRGRAAV